VPANVPITFGPGVTSFVVKRHPLLLDLATFQGDEFALGVYEIPAGVTSRMTRRVWCRRWGSNPHEG